ncbi:Uncharacterised protein [Bordetella pertussis]|nr:Uncharacterised protein [Bordetella pertussis]CPK58083.1 Uncharacterised protein [Bordetella pertussis]CPM65848.1 Uncharacterised protein [Bordetella pertussis]
MQPLHVGAGCAGAGDAVGNAVGGVRRRPQDVLGQGQHHGPRPARQRDLVRPMDEFRDALRVVDAGHPLGHLAVHPAVVDLLEGLPFGHVGAHLADEQNHRCRVLEGGMHAYAGVGGARPARHEADAGLAGQLAIGFGHEGRAALLAADSQPDVLRIVAQGIQHGQIAFAGHAEGLVHAVDLQRIDQDTAAGTGGKSRIHDFLDGQSCDNRHGSGGGRGRPPGCRQLRLMWAVRMTLPHLSTSSAM